MPRADNGRLMIRLIRESIIPRLYKYDLSFSNIALCEKVAQCPFCPAPEEPPEPGNYY